MHKFIFSLIAIFALAEILFPVSVFAQSETHEDLQGIWRARVIEIISEEERLIPGTDTRADIQEIRAEILEGESKGKIVTVENDYLNLKEGETFFLNYLITLNGDEIYTVADADRRFALFGLLALFAGVIIFFGGKQGLRSLMALGGSLFVIGYLLLPSLLSGFPPVPTSIVFAIGILFIAIFFTHGWNRESLVAFMGTCSAVILTGILALFAVSVTRLSGFASDESVFLNMTTAGRLDFSGLLLGAILIGVLGVLDDIAITQAAVVRELYGTNPNLSPREVYKKAIRVGREHVGALVNTLALAYTGAALPLLLLFYNSEASKSFILNGEIFATEIVRTIVGSIGLVLTVPITTALAVRMLRNYKGKSTEHGHHH
jgi:uncharacterized membrane protein